MSWTAQKRSADKPHRLVPVTEVLESHRRSIPSRTMYAAFRMALIQRVLAESLKPIEVAQILEASANGYPEVTLEECRRYRQMGDAWRT